MTHTIQYEVGNDGIALLTIDLPGRSMNILTPELLHDLETLTDRISSDDAVKGAVLTSGKKSFIAGADIMDLVTVYDRGLNPSEAAGFSRELNRKLRKLETCGKPVAAAINGLALGGGLEVCLACHYRVLANDPGVVIGLPEVTIGLMPGGGGTQRLPRLIGTEKALPLILQGENIRPEKALELGIVHELAPAQEVVERAKQWLLESGDPLAPWDKKGFKVPGGAGAMSPRNAQTFMVGTSLLVGETRHNYPAPIAAMSAVYEGCITPIDTGLDIEAQYFGTLLAGPVARNMMRTLFINKGAADKLARRLDGIRQVRKTPIVVNDSRGFYTSRVSGTATLEGITMLAEGVKPALVENIARMAGLPVGPLAVADEGSLEQAYRIGQETAQAMGKEYPADPGQEVIRRMVEDLDRKGKRFGAGFYDYPADAKKFLWPGLAQEFPGGDEQPPVDELIKRLLYIQALETARCFEEGVITHPEDGDIGSIFGWGFPPWTGGTLSLIDTVGIAEFVSECDRMAETYGPRFEVSDWLRDRAQKNLSFY